MASKQNWDALNEAIRRSGERRYVPTGASGASPTTPRYDIPEGPLWNPETFDSSVEKRPDELGFLDRLFDVISRPAFALNNVIKDTYDKDPNTDNPLESLWAGLSGIDKTRGADISKTRRAAAGDFSDNDGDFATGLAWDLFTDPLNFIPLGWLGKGASAGYKGITKGKAAVRELGPDDVIPAEATAAEAIARQTQPPSPGAGPTGGGTNPPSPNTGPTGGGPTGGAAPTTPTPTPGPGPTGGRGGGSPMPGAAPTPAGAPGSLNSVMAMQAGKARRAAGSVPTQSVMPTIGQGARAATPSGLGNFNAFTPTGPKAPFDLDQIGENLRNLVAPPTGRQGVGFNGPQVTPKVEGQQGMFGAGDLERAAPKAPLPPEEAIMAGLPVSRFQAGAEGVTDLSAVKRTRPRAPFSEREVREVSKIPTDWHQGTKDAIKAMAGKPLPKWLVNMMEPTTAAAAKRVDDVTVAAAKVEDTKAVTDAVAEQVTSRPSVIHPVDESAPPRVSMPESTGDVATDLAAASNKIPVSNVANDLVTTTAARTGETLVETAAKITGEVPIVVPTAARKAGEAAVRTTSQQYEEIRALTNKATTWVRNQERRTDLDGMDFKQKKVAMQGKVMEDLKASKAANESKGIYDNISSPGGASYPMHPHDVYEALGPALVNKMQFSKWSIPPSSQMAAAAKSIELLQAGKSADEAIPEIVRAIHAAHHTGQTFDKRAVTYATEIWGKREALHSKAMANLAEHATRDSAIGKEVGGRLGDDLAKTLDDPDVGVGEKLAAVADLPNAASKAARASGASDNGATIATGTAGARIAEKVIESDIQTARHVQQSNRLQSTNSTMNARGSRQQNPWTSQPGQQAKARRTSNNTNQVNKQQQRWARQQVKIIQTGAQMAGVRQIDVPGVVTDGLFRRMLDGIIGAVSGGYGMGKLFPIGRQAFNHFGDTMAQFNNIMVRLREHDPLDVHYAFEALRNRSGSAGLSATQKTAYADLNAAMENTISMSSGVNSWGDTSAFRNGFELDTINQLMRKHDVGFEYRAKDNHLEVPEQWREVTNIEDPIGFLNKHRQVQMELSSHSAVGRYFSAEFGSAVKQPGMLKIARSKDFDLSHMVDRDMYYHPEHIDMLGRYSREIMKNTNFNNKLMKDFIDPYLSAWKLSSTVLRVSHHMRNFIGDSIFTGMDGARYMNPANNLKALEVQRVGGKLGGTTGWKGKKGLDGVQDDLARVNALLSPNPPKATGKAVSVKMKNGKTEDVSYNQIEWWAHQSGMLLDYRKLEDILEASGGGLNKPLDAINELSLIQVAGKVSEVSSNNARLAHLIGLMQNGKVTGQFDSAEAMMRSLSTRVLKFHPDASGLSKFEGKYMRRVFPFYQWFKQAAPTMFMTTLTNPQRPIAIQKVHTNLQGMLGMEPGEEGKFPEGSYYPDFLRKSLFGPLANDNRQGTMVDYGSPTEAMASVLQGNVAANIGEMLNPLAKIPIGLQQGHHLFAEEHYIPDQSEWIDRGIPYLNQLSALSGISATGSIEELLSSGKLDESRAMEKGEKDFFFNQSMQNYWLPFNMQDTDRASYFNIARQDNQKYQEENDPFLMLKDRIEKGRIGLPSVATGRMSE